MAYFSDEERGPRARVQTEFTSEAWEGIASHIHSLFERGAFGKHFPETCPDGGAPVGNHEMAFEKALKAEIPEIEWPLPTETKAEVVYDGNGEKYVPKPEVILDLIQFCYHYVSEPIPRHYHNYFKHYHLWFDAESGRRQFRENINHILYRNGLSYELTSDGNIKRHSAPMIGEAFESIRFESGDGLLDQILEDARKKYLSHEGNSIKEAVEKLWDAWERLKTLKTPGDKKDSINRILDEVSTETEFRELIETEAATLTNVGNRFHIRHSEATQIQVEEEAHLEYLFHRLLGMILLILKSGT